MCNMCNNVLHMISAYITSYITRYMLHYNHQPGHDSRFEMENIISLL